MTTHNKALLDQIVQKFIQAGIEKKAEGVVGFDLQEKGWIAEYVIVLGANNTIHAKALVEEMNSVFLTLSEEELGELYPHFKYSGNTESGWIVIDLNSILIHCITTEIREFYTLDSVFEKQGVVYHY